MIDKILHAITNRANFPSAGFMSVSGFAPATPSPAAAAVMQLLHLSDTQNDYYVQGALAAVDAFPEIREAFREGDRSYAVQEFQRPQDIFTGVSPAADLNGPFMLHRRPDTFPVDFAIPLTYLDPSTLQAGLDGTQISLPCSIGAGVIFPEWPLDSGISGGLALVGQNWGSSFQGNIQHMPTGFPYQAAVRALDANIDKNELLLHAGLIEHYTFARDAVEKFATVLLALGTANIARWP